MKTYAWDEMKEEHVQSICNLWNREIGSEFPMREALFKQNSVEDESVFGPASSFILNDHNECIGVLVAKCTQSEETKQLLAKDIAWIQCLLIDSTFRRRGLGSELLEKAEAALFNTGVKKIALGRDPFHYFPGIPSTMTETRAWFERRGYSCIKTVVDFMRSEKGRDIEPLPSFEATTFSILTLDDKERFLAFMHGTFPGRWEYEAIKYFQLGGTGREYVVIKKEDDIIGFCRINDPDSPIIAQNVYWAPHFDGKLGGIGPLGVDRTYRGQGYGAGVVQAAMTTLKKRDVDYLLIDWTEHIEFYQKFDFKIIWKYDQLEKNLAE